MGFSSISPGSLILIIIIILLIFGTSKLKTIGKDLADAIKNFRKGMSNNSHKEEKNNKTKNTDDSKNGD